ncbi:MAG TPA: penicillin-binding protein 2 [Acidimicrobiia bacterium]|nr:penicillin-binding protein 2 [Acidimicrobiia bacterium]
MPARRPPIRPRPPAAHVARPARRLGICSALLILAFGLLAARVGQLQIANGGKYKQLSVDLALHTIPLTAQRGSVFDRNGRDLAMSIERTTVYADPTMVNDPVGEAAKLAAVLHVKAGSLLAALSNKPGHPRRFAYIAHAVADDVALAVQALKLPGIGFVPESARSYPAGSLAAAVIGRVRSDGPGLDGIELQYNKLLAGKSGELKVEQDPLGHDIPNTQQTRVDAQRGTDVVLSIDEDLQWQAEYSLLDQVKATGAKSGMAVVVDLTNGGVVAMATVHGATPTTPAQVAGASDNNAPLTDLFEPGSTNKLITLSWALERGHVAANTPFLVPYSIRVPGQVNGAYADAEPHYGTANGIEHWTTSDILRESSNVGTIEIAMKMKNQELADGMRAFGLGAQTSVEWPYQPGGLLIPPTQYYSTGKYSTAIGYGVAVTAMQMLDAFGTIANGGTTRPPHLLEATIDAKGTRRAAAVPAGTRVVSENTAAVMTQMLKGVVANGTGACAAVPGYDIAGKTGTAKKALATGGYSPAATMASFIGFAPAEHPRFATLVALDENNLSYGGEVAAPVFSEITQFALQQYGVSPTDVANKQYAAAQVTAQAAGHACAVPHGSDLTAVQARLAAQSQAQSAAATGGGTQPAGTQPGAAGAQTAGSLPANPSKHT